MSDGAAFGIFQAQGNSPILLTCEHACARIPERYGSLGLALEQVVDHIGWDIGAADLAREIALALDAALVESGCSRLVIDCNRATDAPDLIVAETHGVIVPGNAALDAGERERRRRQFYDPYHDAVDAVLQHARGTKLLVSVHSFTPASGGIERRLDVGVLYDDHESLALKLADSLRQGGLRVQLNEPYSGFDGMIHSARSHGIRNDVAYLEIEVNNALLRTAGDVRRVCEHVVPALRAIV